MEVSFDAPRIYVSIATIPGREATLELAVRSLMQQLRPPEHIYVVAPSTFTNRNHRESQVAGLGNRSLAASLNASALAKLRGQHSYRRLSVIACARSLRNAHHPPPPPEPRTTAQR